MGFLKKLGLVLLAIIAAFFVIVAALFGDAHGHDHGEGSWINNQRLTDPVSGEWCCNIQDCREETDNIKAEDGGYRVIDTGEFIPAKRVIWKSPGGWWRCRYLAGEQAGKTRCLIGPPQGS